MQRLEGKIALITGAARGIGAAIAKTFTQQGAIVILTDIVDDAGKKQAIACGPKAKYHRLDVRLEDDWKRVTAAVIAENGGLDILVNNAGITGFAETSGPHDPENLDLVSWQAVHDTNLTGVALGCKYAIKAMKGRCGSIVNISSRSGLVGIPGATAYASSKAGVRNHTKSVALYCAEKGLGIRCNSVHPAAILTPMWDPMLGEGEGRKQAMAAVAKDIPLGYIGAPEDVAFAVLYLASDEARYITGIELTVDGGILAGSAARPD